MVIGYYVHHHGAGHLTRARVLAATLRSRGHDVVLLGSDLRGAPGVTLPQDDDGPAPFEDPDASGALHWAPLRSAGYSARMEAIAAWVRACRPHAVVVDVSVEVTAFLRLLGVPTVVVAQPGDRDDEAHTLAYRCATAILAPWPPEAQPCPALRPFADKVTHTGGISGLAVPRRKPNVGVVLTGRGADVSSPLALVDRLRTQLPITRWVEVGGSHWVNEVGSLLARAHVVVSHCGQNAIADIAALDIPAVLCPQARPHAEQDHLAAELSRLGLGVVVSPEGAAHLDWASVVASATQMPLQWGRWRTESAALRAADLIEGVAHG